MSRWHLLALPILAIVAMGTTVSGGSFVREELTRAVRAPYEALLSRRSAAAARAGAGGSQAGRR